MKADVSKDLAIVTSAFEYHFDGLLMAKSRWQYQVNSEGKVSVDIKVQLNDILPEIPRIGASLTLEKRDALIE